MVVRLLPLLPLLVACNAGPLEWSSASTWTTRETYRGCRATTAGAPELYCTELSAKVIGTASRVATSSAPTIGVGTCIATVNPVTGAVTGAPCVVTVHRSGVPHDVTLRAVSARVGNDGAAMVVEPEWAITTAEGASGTLLTATSYTPVR